MAELQPVALNPFSRIRNTASFSSSYEGDSLSSQLNAWVYHSKVAGVTLCRYCLSRRN